MWNASDSQRSAAPPRGGVFVRRIIRAEPPEGLNKKRGGQPEWL